MKNVQKIDLGLTGYDELFMNDSERQENRLPRIYDIPISEIDDFPDHPFKVKVDEDMDQLVQSIKERGIITPVTLRPKEDGRYEIVSGHRRKKACELAGLDTVKAEVREMTRDEAIILMVESNLQRSTILPSEKAFSYKMRLEAMNRQGQRTDLTCSPLGNKLQGVKSSNVMAEEVGESKNTIFRYIRLTELIPELLTLVDDSRIAFRPAVELSYLKKEEQAALLEEISYTDGTNRINGYKIMEETLNLKDVRIFDYIEDENGKKTAVLNKKETAIAQGKQELIKQAFADWIWSDPERRESLTKMYNEKFNSVRPREYDGSHMSFVGINPEITLRPHQVNAIAHILYGGNTLLAHVVGAGKTFEMVAAAQESKRLGLCQKSLFVVPNHLTEQWASEYLQLYPSANILVATKKDFETKNRKKFCGRIATGDYDAIIIGHSQFEKIPMSIERQRAILEQQLDEILEGISELKRNRGDNFSIKQLERTKKTVKQKLEKLNDQSRKDDVVTFEELGVDRIFIDEAHYYKNLAAFTKMRNVGGISQTEAMKSSDLYMKCRYLDELTGGRGVVFATGTPISNSMVEMYTMQKYLQYGTLRRNDLIHFDAWASTFGETVTAIELSPEGYTLVGR